MDREQEDKVVYGEDREWAKKAAPSIEAQIETVKGIRSLKGYPLEAGSTRKKEKKPQIKFDENQEDLP
ncbi:hypothetical protein B9Z19DRAFT_1163518, partial [Tuber borchii]